MQNLRLEDLAVTVLACLAVSVRTLGVKGGASPAHATLHLKTSLRTPEVMSTSASTNFSFKSCSDGKGAKKAGGRCHWKPQFQSCMQAVQDFGRLVLTWR